MARGLNDTADQKVMCQNRQSTNETHDKLKKYTVYKETNQEKQN